ncbi:hypothetical protein CAG63_18310 [Vibrio sp. V37_P2S8PM304]|uniref:hypothetical protein n=1 Tax=Vibrio sp. V37_P2S8PM304 TaxID=1938688 RepID=UPI001372CE92|nr:hypothetical protein [Vibrio sp. V37_P2S8PM304]NAX32001.1 hypothetical protein [Vibrio sp. V37_P2S8PM304]
MQHTTDPNELTYPIKPMIFVDDFKADVVSVSLSPEIPLSSFSLKECFTNVQFKNDSKKAWANELRKIADQLDGQESK